MHSSKLDELLYNPSQTNSLFKQPQLKRSISAVSTAQTSGSVHCQHLGRYCTELLRMRIERKIERSSAAAAVNMPL